MPYHESDRTQANQYGPTSNSNESQPKDQRDGTPALFNYGLEAYLAAIEGDWAIEQLASKVKRLRTERGAASELIDPEKLQPTGPTLADTSASDEEPDAGTPNPAPSVNQGQHFKESGNSPPLPAAESSEEEDSDV